MARIRRKYDVEPIFALFLVPKPGKDPAGRDNLKGWVLVRLPGRYGVRFFLKVTSGAGGTSAKEPSGVWVENLQALKKQALSLWVKALREEREMMSPASGARPSIDTALVRFTFSDGARVVHELRRVNALESACVGSRETCGHRDVESP